MSREMFQRSTDPEDITFYINGKKYLVSDKYSPTTSLNDYIRDVAGLKGTKVMCKEAGCGCCAVTVTHASNGDVMETMSINSCVCPLYSVDGWQITTTEGIGNSKEGFHPIQNIIAKHNGTQCGYCTPGFVMSMYGLLHQDQKPTQQEIEDSFDGHICRCTGYRSILDAMKSFAVDSTAPNAKCIDIEDLNKKLCYKTGQPCRKENVGKKSSVGGAKQEIGGPPVPLAIDLGQSRWYRPVNLKNLAELMQQHKTHSTTVFFGNTSSGIFKHQGPYEVYIDLRAVKELHLYKEGNTSVIFGGGTTLTKLKKHLKDIQHKPGFHYCARVIRHLKVLASVLVRNAGSMAGNLMIKHAHPDFPSDLFTMLEAIGASVEIFDSNTAGSKKHSLLQFLRDVDMKGKIIVTIEIPKWEKNDHYRSFKITPRWQNAHAYVNAAFKITLNDRKVVGKPNFIIGGISAQTVHAIKAEEFITNKTLSDEVINETLKIMYEELHPEAEPLTASPKYRKELAVNLLYKTLLEVYKPSKYNILSGSASMERSLSSGLQTFQEKTDDYPLRKPMPKKTASLQTSGEAEYVNDIPNFRHELSAALVVASVGVGKIGKIDTTAALQIPGVVRYLGADDIPKGGQNNYIPSHPVFGGWNEELFASKDIEYAGQLIGIILAETSALAEEGARMVKVTYENVQTPITDLETAIKKNSIHEGATHEKIVGDLAAGMKEAHIIVEGDVSEGTQYHFYIENQVALCVPSEDGIDIYSATQAGDMLQRSVSQVLGKPMNYINLTVPRLGGSFGGKLIHSFSISSAAAIATEITGRPVRLNVDLSTNMKFNSKRFPIYAKYKAGCDNDGKLKFIQVDIYVDSGVRPTPMIFDLIGLLDQGYYCPNWKVTLMQMKTNKAVGAATRGPGSVPASLIIETIMEHLAKNVHQHPIMFKEINLYETGQKDIEGIELTYCSMKSVWNRLKHTAEVTSRMEDVNRFNKNNLWRKRGITMCAVKYGMAWFPGGLPTHVSIFAGDGTVTVLTTGVEMGQGLYTKVAQAVAHSLKVPLENVKVRPNQNNVLANASVTGGSTTSERCVMSAVQACTILNERLQPLREKMPNADWPSLLSASVFSNVELQASSTHFNNTGVPIIYFTYMAGVVETEVDVLTGEFQVRRVDIMADFGESMNPTIDIGQIEGAFVMGLGAYLSENLTYDKTTGDILNDGTWEYKPPTSKDIPIDWRIHLLPDAPNPAGILSSKAVGEPPIGLAMGALLSIKSSIESAREELTGQRDFLPVVAPYTVERFQQGAGISVDHLRVGGHN
uniref:FAD-binding PCMH-type domain-containing protein n=1 Tax=Arion vulgaris TaxID=1028688 RepID=A0A0B7AUW5_9EUPU